MADVISCPSCQRKLQVPETLLGQDVQCPSCGATFVARVEGQIPSAAPSLQPLPSRWDADERADKPRSDHKRHSDDDDFDSDYKPRRRDLAPHRGALILTLGIIGLVVLPILAPVAWILGNADMTEIRAGRMDPEGEGLTQAGRICGIIGSVFLGLTVCCCGLMFLSAIGNNVR